MTAPTPTRNPVGIAAGAVFLLASGGLLGLTIATGATWPTASVIIAASGSFVLALVGAAALASAMTRVPRDHRGRPIKHNAR